MKQNAIGKLEFEKEQKQHEEAYKFATKYLDIGDFSGLNKFQKKLFLEKQESGIYWFKSFLGTLDLIEFTKLMIKATQKNKIEYQLVTWCNSMQTFWISNYEKKDYAGYLSDIRYYTKSKNSDIYI